MPEPSTRADKQADAEANVKGFRDDLGPFVVAAEETRMAMVFTDARANGNPIIFANDSFLKLTGYERDEVLGQAFNSFASRADAATLDLIETEFRATPSAEPSSATAARTAVSPGRRS